MIRKDMPRVNGEVMGASCCHELGISVGEQTDGINNVIKFQLNYVQISSRRRKIEGS